MRPCGRLLRVQARRRDRSPVRDAICFLRTHQLEEVLEALVCMEEASQTEPEPVRMALNALGVRRA